MQLLLLGAPGVGKGSQAVVLSKKLSIPQISVGDIFRSNISKGTELGKMAKSFMDKGELVPDEVTIRIIEDRLAQDDCRSGFILDGFPRNLEQARSLDLILDKLGKQLDAVLNIHLDDIEIVKRLSGRRVCLNCNSVFHMTDKPPKHSGLCDECSEVLVTREDDTEQTILNRLAVYHEKTKPLTDYYKSNARYFEIHSEHKMADTTRNVFLALGLEN
jgi:adenylate kinase